MMRRSSSEVPGLGGAPLGAPFVGWLADQFGTRWSLLCGGSIAILATGGATALFFILRRGAPPALPRSGALLGGFRRGDGASVQGTGASDSSTK
jgi:MFS family permease